MHRGPVPARLTGLPNLGYRCIGDKVRFLGCITNYNIPSGVVTLRHDCNKENGHKALVDINLLLESLQPSNTCIGEWVNVIGYITKQDSTAIISGEGSPCSTEVQAILFWSAGSVDVIEYGRTIADLENESKYT